MSRQIQIRRGTAAEHTNFTGAIGEITMDTTNKTLRVHDGETAGGTILAKQSEIPAPYTMPENYDFVIETQAPTSNNGYKWYRKYKSGWIEQGIAKITISTTEQSATLPVTMANATYACWATKLGSNGNYAYAWASTASTVKYKSSAGSNQENGIFVAGFAA